MRRAVVGLSLLLVAATAAAAGRAQIVNGVILGSFDRADWPQWAAVPGQCWDVRQEILRRDSLDAVTWDLASGACRVTAGLWIDPYSLKPAWVRTPATVDVDHTLALRWVHDHGGAEWSPSRRAAYANDLRYRWHLRALDAGVNRSKGAKGPADFTPATPEARCEWGTAAAVIIVIWDLQPEPRERAAIREHVAAC